MEIDELSSRVIGCTVEVHLHPDPGQVDLSYGKCFEHDLNRNGIAFTPAFLACSIQGCYDRLSTPSRRVCVKPARNQIEKSRDAF